MTNTFDTALQDRLALACKIADKARTISLPAFHTDIVSENKNADKAGALEFDPVTKADIATEKSLRDGIEKTFPNDNIEGEEFPPKHTKSNWSWCLDPIDGTRAFVAGVPVWSTLIAVSYKDRPLIGIIDLPALDERYIGCLDGSKQQAWKIVKGNTSPLRTAPCHDLNDVILGCTEPMAMFSQGQKAAYEMIRRTARFTRLGLDAYGYALVASGKMDMIIEASMKPYDILALIPVVEGAGGKITNWHGGTNFESGAVVCTGDPDLITKTYPYLKRAMN
ncbi:MAG: histidinol-phosphatase [Robiginitomaculum sp.]|nr:histidinol-phosphatase [Robiginitomaculum sp.]